MSPERPLVNTFGSLRGKLGEYGVTTPMLSYKGHRYPVKIINHCCVWLYFRFPFSFREVEEMMLERGVRNGNAANRFFRKLLTGLQYVPRVIVTDKLGSYQVRTARYWPRSSIAGRSI
jgi:transposase-like protein